MGLFDVENARLVRAHKLHVDSQSAVPPHTHEEWEFIYIARGSGSIYAPSQTLSPRTHHVFVYPPGLPLAAVSNPEDPAEVIFMLVQTQGPPLPSVRLLTDTTGEFGWLCQRIESEFASRGITDLAQAYTKAFLYLVERALNSDVSIEYDAVERAVQYIRANYESSIGLDELAAIACVSKCHLVHRFKAKLGISPLRYIREVRVDSAKRLLATTDIPVREIAERVGFRNPLYFSRIFKHVTGLSPTAFRLSVNCAK